VNCGSATEVLCKTTSHPLKVKLIALLQISVWPPLDLNNILRLSGTTTPSWQIKFII